MESSPSFGFQTPKRQLWNRMMQEGKNHRICCGSPYAPPHKIRIVLVSEEDAPLPQAAMLGLSSNFGCCC